MNKTIRRTALSLAFSIVLAGWLAFEFVPNEVDTALGTFNSWQMFFFFTAAMLFINIHHYFIERNIQRFFSRRIAEAHGRPAPSKLANRNRRQHKWPRCGGCRGRGLRTYRNRRARVVLQPQSINHIILPTTKFQLRPDQRNGIDAHA